MQKRAVEKSPVTPHGCFRAFGTLSIWNGGGEEVCGGEEGSQEGLGIVQKVSESHTRVSAGKEHDQIPLQ